MLRMLSEDVVIALAFCVIMLIIGGVIMWTSMESNDE